MSHAVHRSYSTRSNARYAGATLDMDAAAMETRKAVERFADI